MMAWKGRCPKNEILFTIANEKNIKCLVFMVKNEILWEQENGLHF